MTETPNDYLNVVFPDKFLPIWEEAHALACKDVAARSHLNFMIKVEFAGAFQKQFRKQFPLLKDYGLFAFPECAVPFHPVKTWAPKTFGIDITSSDGFEMSFLYQRDDMFGKSGFCFCRMTDTSGKEVLTSGMRRVVTSYWIPTFEELMKKDISFYSNASVDFPLQLKALRDLFN